MVAIMPMTADGDEDDLPLRVARMQEICGYFNSYTSLFVTKLLVTALQGPVEAWCFSMLSAVLEVADTSYGFWSDADKLNRLRAELRSGEHPEAEASEQEE